MEMEETYERWKKKPTPEGMGELLESSQPVLRSAVQSYAGGNEALMGRARILASGAFQNYDPAKGTKLRTHLMTQLQPLTRHAKAYGQVTRVPERVQTDLYHLRQAEQTFKEGKGREASDLELAERTNLSPSRIAHVRNFARPEAAESSFADNGGAINYPGVERPDPERILIEYVHHDLDPLDRKILEWRTGLYGKEQLSNNEIAKRLNLTPGAISQRAAKVAKRISDLKGTV
jgi:DNA-directed RNA polymerase specialized sigma subunit